MSSLSTPNSDATEAMTLSNLAMNTATDEGLLPRAKFYFTVDKAARKMKCNLCWSSSDVTSHKLLAFNNNCSGYVSHLTSRHKGEHRIVSNTFEK